MSNNRASVPQQETAGKLARFWAEHNRILICIFMCLLTHPLWAQDGQFYGVITDQGGSAVPHAEVVLQNTGAGLDREAATFQAPVRNFGQGALRIVF